MFYSGFESDAAVFRSDRAIGRPQGPQAVAAGLCHLSVPGQEWRTAFRVPGTALERSRSEMPGIVRAIQKSSLSHSTPAPGQNPDEVLAGACGEQPPLRKPALSVDLAAVSRGPA